MILERLTYTSTTSTNQDGSYSLNTTHEKPQTSIKTYIAIQWRSIRKNYMEVIKVDKVDEAYLKFYIQIEAKGTFKRN